jgi:antirestriction protein ArdC
VAEMDAAFCCASLAIAPTVRHADYIGSWLEVLREDSRAIVRAASQASKAAEYLLKASRQRTKHLRRNSRPRNLTSDSSRGQAEYKARLC